jgi:hypothetical protein
MPTSVTAAFNQFMAEHINLDPTDTAVARASRDWLLGQVGLLPQRYSDFPHLYNDVDLHYGSFARRTKIRELDDVDLIIGVSALGTTYIEYGGTVCLSVPEGIRLRRLCHDDNNLLNSRRVINKFIEHLSDIPQYEKSDIKRNGSAAVLSLKSYTWAFDIVPAFFTTPELDGRTYYLIPDGEGHWMQTDPRIDQARVTTINNAHDGNVLSVVRLLKYWNRRPTMPTIPAYLLESMVLDYYALRPTKATAFVDIEAVPLLTYISNAILGPVSDPKRIQGDINSVPWVERLSIANRAAEDARRASAARAAENSGDHRVSIRIWQDVFGPDFPSYG